MSDNYREIAARFADDTAKHEMTVLHDDGLYRHLRFMQPSPHSWLYKFDLVTWPGCLTIRGDFGDAYTFSRVPDMFEFFRGKRINPDYWAQKLDGDRDSVKEFQESLFIKAIWEQANYLIEQEHVEPEQADRFRQAIKDDIVEGHLYDTADEAYRAVEEFEFYNDPSKESAYRHRPDVCFEDAWDWFGATKDYTWSFLWACHAIVSGIARYDRMGRYKLRTLATAPKPADAADGRTVTDIPLPAQEVTA